MGWLLFDLVYFGLVISFRVERHWLGVVPVGSELQTWCRFITKTGCCNVHGDFQESFETVSSGSKQMKGEACLGIMCLFLMGWFCFVGVFKSGC